ncbi:MAG: hypothetical protein K9K88_09850 [Desulfobacterales bacterium]|nr:hypothetical protein [Desulfobacterales bacterium]
MNKKADEKKTVTFDYIKTEQHTEFPVSGAHGGITPAGKIQISFYQERLAIPKQVKHELKEDFSLGDEIQEERIARNSFIRSVPMTFLMDPNTALGIYQWLGERLKDCGVLGKIDPSKKTGASKKKAASKKKGKK